MKRLRPFVSFNYDLRGDVDAKLKPADKAKITRYYNQLSTLYNGDTVSYRPKSNKGRKVAKEASGMTGAEFKTYLVPSPTGTGRVKITKDGYTITRRGSETKAIYLDQTQLVMNTREYLESKLKADGYYLINSQAAGKFGGDWMVSGDRDAVTREIERAVMRYNWDKRDGEEGRPFITLIELSLTDQVERDQYIIDRDSALRDKRAKKRARNKRDKRARLKGR